MLGAAWFAGGALLGAALMSGSPAAWADFQTAATSSAELAADVLQPPSGLTGTPLKDCGSLGVQIDLTWAASPTAWTESYDVLLSTTTGGPYEVVPPQGGQDPTSTSRWVGGLDRKRDYYVVVRSVRGSWWASTPEIAVIVPAGKKC